MLKRTFPLHICLIITVCVVAVSAIGADDDQRRSEVVDRLLDWSLHNAGQDPITTEAEHEKQPGKERLNPFGSKETIEADIQNIVDSVVGGQAEVEKVLNDNSINDHEKQGRLRSLLGTTKACAVCKRSFPFDFLFCPYDQSSLNFDVAAGRRLPADVRDIHKGAGVLVLTSTCTDPHNLGQIFHIGYSNNSLGRTYPMTCGRPLKIFGLPTGEIINVTAEFGAFRDTRTVTLNDAEAQHLVFTIGPKTKKQVQPAAANGPATQRAVAPLDKSLNNSLGMKFVYIPPGTFTMGSPPDSPNRELDETAHKVILSEGFYLQTTEVTQGQWETVMGDNPSTFADCGENCPVENVSWYNAQEFIAQLNQMEQEQYHYRLPTEAQWEYACRADSQTAYSFSDHDALLNGYAWYSANSGNQTHPVGLLSPNAWGLYDMHGNVWEWCLDRYGDYPSGLVTDPMGPPSGSSRVRRGGSWYHFAGACRSALRSGYGPGSRRNFIGFRLVLSPAKPAG